MAYKGKTLQVLKKTDPAGFKARLAHLVATGNTAAVPAQYLTGKALQQRNLNARLNAPVTPGSSLTNRDLAHEAQSTIATTYAPQEQGITTQESQLANQRQNVPQYYQAYMDAIRGASAQAGTDAARTAANIQGLGASAQQAATSQDTSVLAKLQADAQARGTTVDPSLAQKYTDAAAASRSVSDAQAGTSSLMGQANQNFLRTVLAGAGQSQNEALGKIGAQQQQLGQQRTALRREEGLANQSYRTKRRSEEVTNVATSAIANVNAAAKAGAQDTALITHGINPTTGKYDPSLKPPPKPPAGPSTVAKPPSNYTGSPADWNNLSQPQRDSWVTKHPTSTSKGPKPPKPVTGPGSLPAGKEASIVTQIERVYSTLTTPPNWPSGPKAGKPMTAAEVYDSLKRGGALTPGKPLDPRILDVARSRLHNKGAVGKFGLDQAHALGIHVGGRWKIASGSSNASAPYTRPGGRVS